MENKLKTVQKILDVWGNEFPNSILYEYEKKYWDDTMKKNNSTIYNIDYLIGMMLQYYNDDYMASVTDNYWNANKSEQKAVCNKIDMLTIEYSNGMNDPDIMNAVSEIDNVLTNIDPKIVFTRNTMKLFFMFENHNIFIIDISENGNMLVESVKCELKLENYDEFSNLMKTQVKIAKGIQEIESLDLRNFYNCTIKYFNKRKEIKNKIESLKNYLENPKNISKRTINYFLK